MCKTYFVWLTALAAVACGCNGKVGTTTTATAPDAPTGPAWFEDVSAAKGLSFVHDAGPVGSFALSQIMGSGVALFDFDGDGRLDVYFIQNAGPKSSARNRLLQQEADGRFRDVSAGSGLDVAGFGMGCAVGDMDNDGKPDVALTEYGRTRLFKNLGAGKFQDVSVAAGIDNPQWGTSAAFFDYDRDGWLDLVVVNYVEFDPSIRCGPQSGLPDYCHPNTFKGTVDRLWRNLGRTGNGQPRFEDVTVRAGLAGGTGNGLGVLCLDFSGDGRPDIFVANDSQTNRLWIQQADGTFKDEAHSRGVAFNGMGSTAANMGIAVGDVDGDGLFDLFVTHLAEEMHTLWRQGPRGHFRDRTVGLGLTSAKWRGTGFGAVFADFNRDGWLDLAFANGRVARRKDERHTTAPDQFWSMYRDRNQIFAGTGGGKFEERSLDHPALTASAGVFRGLAVGDIDNDGAVDLVVTQTAGPARLLRNVAPQPGHWLGVRAVDPRHSRDALGAEIRIRAGGREYWGTINPAFSYLTSSDPRAHFGLGTADTIEHIEVLWPDGLREEFRHAGIDRYIEVRRGNGTALTEARK